MTDVGKVISAWERFRNSNPYGICSGREFRAMKEPDYCMGQMIGDTIELLKELLRRNRCKSCKEGGNDHERRLCFLKDRNEAISHLQIIQVWATFSLEKDLNFFTEKHLRSIESWTRDALKLLKDQEETIDKLERDLSVAQNMLNYYINGGD